MLRGAGAEAPAGHGPGFCYACGTQRGKTTHTAQSQGRTVRLGFTVCGWATHGNILCHLQDLGHEPISLGIVGRQAEASRICHVALLFAHCDAPFGRCRASGDDSEAGAS